MADQLKPGALGAASDPGNPAAFAGSMAAAIESALNALLLAEGRPALPIDNSAETRDRRMLFVAIAQGVVNHLAAHHGAFVIRADDSTPLGNHHLTVEHT
jgi:hypothetical protein